MLEINGDLSEKCLLVQQHKENETTVISVQFFSGIEISLKATSASVIALIMGN